MKLDGAGARRQPRIYRIASSPHATMGSSCGRRRSRIGDRGHTSRYPRRRLSLALFDIYPMEKVRWLSYWMYIMWGTMFGVLALIALAIAAVGVYGVVFFTVAQRRREFGLRVALGAQRGQVVGPMMKHVAVLAAGRCCSFVPSPPPPRSLRSLRVSC